MSWSEIQKPQAEFPLYPDMEAHGSLARLFNALFLEMGSPLHCKDSLLFKHAGGYVKYGPRKSQLSLAAKERSFHFDFWQDGVCLGSFWVADPAPIAQVLHQLLALNRNPLELEAEFSWFQLDAKAHAFLNGPRAYTERQWQYLDDHLREHDHLQQLHPVLVLARAHPQRGLLYPFTSMCSLQFSLCTGYPFDTPFPAISMTSLTEIERPIYGVKRRENNAPSEFEGEAEAAINFLANQLPPNCGPARQGTANDL